MREKFYVCPLIPPEVVCCSNHSVTKDTECNTLRSIYRMKVTGAIPDIRHCCSLFVCPIVEAPQRQQNAAFYWSTARLLLEARSVTISMFLSIQHKQIRISINFWFAK